MTSHDEDVLAVDADLLGEVAGEVAGLVADAPERLHVRLLVEASAPRSGVRSRWIASCGDPQQRVAAVEGARLDAVLAAHGDPAGEAEVAVEPRAEDEAAVGLDAEQLPAGPRRGRGWA